MTEEQPIRAVNPAVRWTLRLGAIGLFGGVLLCLSKGGGLACAVGVALPVAFVAAIAGMVVGVVIKVFRK